MLAIFAYPELLKKHHEEKLKPWQVVEPGLSLSFSEQQGKTLSRGMVDVKFIENAQSM